MAQFVVLSEDQKIGLENLKSAFAGSFKKWSTYQPIEIKNNLWIMPLSVMSDPDMKEFTDFVMANKTTDIIIREVDQSEFIEYDLLN